MSESLLAILGYNRGSLIWHGGHLWFESAAFMISIFSPLAGLIITIIGFRKNDKTEEDEENIEEQGDLKCSKKS
jgi:hypothetical protein